MVQGMVDDRAWSVNKIHVDNRDYLAELEADEDKEEKEQAKV